MAVIQCAEKCKFQNDGYCSLEKCSTVKSVNSSGPYFMPLSADNRDSLSQTSDTDKL